MSRVTAVAGLGISVWLTQGQWCNEGKNNQKLIHFDAEFETNFH